MKKYCTYSGKDKNEIRLWYCAKCQTYHFWPLRKAVLVMSGKKALGFRCVDSLNDTQRPRINKSMRRGGNE